MKKLRELWDLFFGPLESPEDVKRYRELRRRIEENWWREHTDTELAVMCLRDASKQTIPLGTRILARAVQHLEDRFEAELFSSRG